MKKLYLLRHAEKQNPSNYEYDHDIELTQKGIEDANIMANTLKRRDITIDLIATSTARRTKTTAKIFAEVLAYDKSIMNNEALYQANVNELIESISYTFDDVKSLMVVGHNPSLSQLANTLVGFKEQMHMCGVIEIEFDCNYWIDISRNNASLNFYEYPRL